MNLIETPIVDAWLLPGNVLVQAVAEGGETAVTLTVTVPGRITSPGRALVEVAHQLALVKAHMQRDGAR